jgi:segregation and condensation protein B
MVRREEPAFDRELADLPADLRWREWLRRIEAVLFASTNPVARDHLARVVGQGASVDLLIEDLANDLEGRPYEVAQVGAGWMLRTKHTYAPAIRAAADVGGQALNLTDFDPAVLAAIAFHQPISRDGLKDIFGKEISRDLIGWLAARDLIGTGPRANPAAAHLIPLSPQRRFWWHLGWKACATCQTPSSLVMRG